ncbi:hypothetical protein SAMN05216551_104236 [Chitinasiproducens palmae]|uniref:Uncharacterized protein n=1 Tax=Chitinasiproducens palmae TaxID=1770053 RepID=A0A1H2PNL5_9BURK|nr:hypothetical protein SAMN05216551_104236 [Chitinasiproducens palmae]
MGNAGFDVARRISAPRAPCAPVPHSKRLAV